MTSFPYAYNSIYWYAGYRQNMDSNQTKLKLFFEWIRPTAAELTIYTVLVMLTIFLCSQDFIDNILFTSGDFNPIRSGIGVIDTLLQKYVGEKVAGSLSLAIFWGLVGVLVNVIWWLWSSFSTELNNDLVFSRYVHPRDTDPKAQLRDFIERTAVRTVAAVIGIIYLNYVLSKGWPSISNRFADITTNWSKQQQWGPLVLTILAELLMLHMTVVITRLVLLRKRVFDTTG